MRKSLLSLAWFPFVATLAGAQPPATITTIAGGGPDRLPASSLYLSATSVVVGPGGALFFTLGARVYTIDAAGRILSIAGTNVGGNAGDGGLATRALLNPPRALAFDAQGDLFLADPERIRRVDAITGIITTVAGGGTSISDGVPATSAALDFPLGVAIDQNGNLFTSEYYAHRVRRIDAVSGIITTVAGTYDTPGFSGDAGQAAQALLNSPMALAADPSGNLYIADRGNHVVRRIAAATGTIERIAGNGNLGHDGDGGPAVLAKLVDPYAITTDIQGNLFIADSGGDDCNSRVRRVDAATGIITRVAGSDCGSITPGDGGPATSAVLYHPQGVAIDAVGDLFIADIGSQDLQVGLGAGIRRVDASTGIITTLSRTAGVDSLGDGGSATDSINRRPFGIAYDAGGNLFISNDDAGVVRRVDASTGIITTVAGLGDFTDCSSPGDGGPAVNACLWDPYGVAIDSSGNLFIAEEYQHRIRRVDARTGVITTSAGNGVGGFAGDGGPATAANLKWPYGVALDAADNLFILDTYNNRVRRVDKATGIISTVAGNGASGYSGDGGVATLASLRLPTGIASDAAGNLFIADRDNCRVRRVDAATNVITTIAGDGTCAYSGDGGPATGARLKLPAGIAVDANGNLVVMDGGNYRVRRIDAATGLIETMAGTGAKGFGGDGGPATAAMISTNNSPLGVAFHPDGNSFAFTDVGNGRIRSVSSRSLPSGAVPEDAAGGSDPLTVTEAPGGDITLSWGVSCVGTDTDFEVYEGSLGNFASHVPRLCSTQAATTATFHPSSGSAYYLVVPRNSIKEGSYGRRSDGAERAAGISACLPQEVAATCQ